MAASKDELVEPKGSANLEPSSAKAIHNQLSSNKIDDEDGYESLDEDDDDGQMEQSDVVDDPPKLDDLIKRFCPTLEEALVSLVAQEPGQTHASALSILGTFFELESQREELDKIEQEIEEEAQEEEDDDEEDDDEDEEEDEEVEEYDQDQDTIEEQVEEKAPTPPTKQQIQSTPVKATSKPTVQPSSSPASSPSRSPAAAAAANAALARFGGGQPKSPLSLPPKSAPHLESKKPPAPPKTLAELGLARPESIKHANAPPVAKPIAARTGPGGRRITKNTRKPTSSSPSSKSKDQDKDAASTPPPPSSPPDNFGKSSPVPKPRMGGIHTIFGNSSSNSFSTSSSSPSRISSSPSPAKRFIGTGVGQGFGTGPQLEHDPQTELALKLKAAGRTAEQIERAMRAARSAEIRARGLSPVEQAIAEREARRLDADTLEKVLAGHIVAPAPVVQVVKKKRKGKGNKREDSMPGASQLAMFARRLAKTPLSIRAQAVATAIAAASRWQAKGQELDEEDALRAAAARAKAKREKEEMERRRLQGDLRTVTEGVDHVSLPADYDEQKVLDQAIRASQGLSSEEDWQSALDKKQREKERKDAAALLAASTPPPTTPSSKNKKKKKKPTTSPPVASSPPVQTSGRGASAISQRSLDALAAARSVQFGETSTPSPPTPASRQIVQPPVGITVPATTTSPPPRSSKPAFPFVDVPTLSANSQTFVPSGNAPPLIISQGLTSDWDEYQALKYLKESFPDYTYDELEPLFDEAKGDLGMIIDKLSEREEDDMKMHFPSLTEEIARIPPKPMPAMNTSSITTSLSRGLEMFKKGFGVIRLPGAGGKDKSPQVSQFQIEEVVVTQMAALSKSPIELRKNEITARKQRREALIKVSRIYKTGGPNSKTQMEEFKALANSWERKATTFSNAAAELEVEDRRRKAARRNLRRTLVPVIGLQEKPIQKEDLPNEIDLHHLTVREAEFITKKYVESWDFENKPELKVITGAGIHSTAGIAKIKPVIYRWLADNSLTLGIDVKAEGNGWFVVRKLQIGF